MIYLITGDGPDPEEVLTCFPTDGTKVALKSGYGKYLSVGKNSVVIGRSDAIGAMEQWEPIFQVRLEETGNLYDFNFNIGFRMESSHCKAGMNASFP